MIKYLSSFKFIFCVICALFLVPLFAFAKGIDYLKKDHKISITSRSIDFLPRKSATIKFGKLIWRGGVVLNSKFEAFGGISGIHVGSEGKNFIAITDQGSWLKGELVYKNNLLSGVKSVTIGPIRGHKNRLLKKNKHRDAESIVLVGKHAFIGFERLHRIAQYHLDNYKIGKKVKNLKLPSQTRKMKYNKGFEALGVLRVGPYKNRFLAFAEDFKTRSGYHKGWVIQGSKYFPIYLLAKKGFSITDLAILKNGDVLIVERFFNFLQGVKMRLRIIKGNNIKPSAKLKGDVLIEVGNKYTIDNMEGVAVHEDSKGKTIITLVSDDNFSAFQRTLLMQFELRKNN